MQARFLKKVVDNYQTMKANSQNADLRQTQAVPASDTTNTISSSSYLTGRNISRNDSEAMVLESGMQEEDIGMPLEMGNYAFSDNEMWEKMFAEAGFRLNDGVFMPEATGS